MSERYDLARNQPDDHREMDPDKMLRDPARWVTKHLWEGSLTEQGRLVLRRLEALRALLAQLREPRV